MSASNGNDWNARAIPWETLDRNTLLRPAQIAMLRERSIHFLANERSGGRGPRYIRDGRSIRYRLGDVLDWLKMQEVGTAEQPLDGSRETQPTGDAS
ncbi:hypothetical protein QNO21_07610 [Microbacterium sp. zg-Y818]|uniref:hypothetical protein n=1 Tax=unclassified Microbacterium TaxID=2609290 RepID=UPI00214AE1E2|nr:MULTISPECIES: hypothetical protein [unclassified Microbacterium]MCR2801171.1 hypothetical protein [Microbacterium sp. zg.Y818]WIM21007.1 hypothetical protein QNO21_07610 [Microbacterium sp. zg-Y818]